MSKKTHRKMIAKVADENLVIDWNGPGAEEDSPGPGDIIQLKCVNGEITEVSMKKKGASNSVRWDDGDILCEAEENEEVLHISFDTADGEHAVQIHCCLGHDKPYFIVDVEDLTLSLCLFDTPILKEAVKGNISVKELHKAAVAGTSGHGKGGGPIP